MRTLALALVILAMLVDCTLAQIPSSRAVYVEDTSALVANPRDRARLARWIEGKHVAEVIPYGLGPLLATPAGRAVLAAWIVEVQARGGVVIAPVAGPDRIAALARLFEEHPAARIDGLVTEHEYWNRRDRAVAFAEHLALLAAMRAQQTAWARPQRTFTIAGYLGYPTADEAARLAPLVDRVFLNYSVATPARAWGHVHPRGGALRERFAWFAHARVPVWPIFYARGEVDMGEALRTHGIAAAEARFCADLAADPAVGKIRVAGFVYFTFEAMPDP